MKEEELEVELFAIILMENALQILPALIGDFVHRKVAADSTGTNDQCFQNQLLYHQG